MLYSIANKYGPRCEIKKIEKILAKAYKKVCNYSRNSSRENSDSDSSLASDRSRDKHRRPLGSKDMNKLDHVVTKT